MGYGNAESFLELVDEALRGDGAPDTLARDVDLAATLDAALQNLVRSASEN